MVSQRRGCPQLLKSSPPLFYVCVCFNHLFPGLGLTVSTAWVHSGSASRFGQLWILSQLLLQFRDTTGLEMPEIARAGRVWETILKETQFHSHRWHWQR